MTQPEKQPVRQVVIVGGGSAGWITAGLIAAEHGTGEDGVAVTLVESPDVKTIGVGEGTWPTMRTTLARIGLSESEFLAQCNASFKQGTRFVGWRRGGPDDVYYHPFSAPAGYPGFNLAAYWQSQRDKVSFADAVGVQGHLCDRDLAPKQDSTPEFAAVANYAYHLDAGRFAGLLQRHCTETLGVRHVQDHVTAIHGADNGDIRAIATASGGELAGDLFVDCTGMASMLLGDHYQVPFLERREVLFNDTALAVQVPYQAEDAAIASQTNATARPGGWIWDIGLTSRRGIGHVYSSAHTRDSEAESALIEYIESTGVASDGLAPRKIGFRPGHRQEFWHRNCVAVGMAAGFLEPLEASALVLVELAGRMISEELPAHRGVMDAVARRFNERFRYRWDRIIEFLKLHYVLSERSDSDYWIDNRGEDSLPPGLRERLAEWRYHVPRHSDFPQVEEVFSAASYQYVLYGMGFETRVRRNARYREQEARAQALFTENIRKANQAVARLPGNRQLLERIRRHGLPALKAG